MPTLRTCRGAVLFGSAFDILQDDYVFLLAPGYHHFIFEHRPDNVAHHATRDANSMMRTLPIDELDKPLALASSIGKAKYTLNLDLRRRRWLFFRWFCLGGLTAGGG